MKTNRHRPGFSLVFRRPTGSVSPVFLFLGLGVISAVILSLYLFFASSPTSTDLAGESSPTFGTDRARTPAVSSPTAKAHDPFFPSDNSGMQDHPSSTPSQTDSMVAPLEIFIPEGGPNRHRSTDRTAASPGRVLVTNRDGRSVVRATGISIVSLEESSASDTGAALDPRGSLSGPAGGSSVTAAASPASTAIELEIPVPAGALVPAAFYDDQPRTEPQQRALNRIYEVFKQQVSTPEPGLSQQEVWEAARKIADHQYLVLYGYEAYNQAHLLSAREALRERRQLQAEQSASSGNP